METIFLTGFSGVGKTMMGRLLASRKDLVYLDIDEAIEKKENKKIKDIFSENGEDYFRRLEKNILFEEVKQGMVVSLGGGTIVDDESRYFVKSKGRVIYLKANAQTIFKNLENEYIERPLLKENFSVFSIEKLLNERRAFYEEAANFTIEVDNRNLDSIFKELLAIYNYINKVKCHIYIK